MGRAGAGNTSDSAAPEPGLRICEAHQSTSGPPVRRINGPNLRADNPHISAGLIKSKAGGSCFVSFGHSADTPLQTLYIYPEVGNPVDCFVLVVARRTWP